jgi:hypothetical protein
MRQTPSLSLALLLAAAAHAHTAEPVATAARIERVVVDGQTYEAPAETITAPPGEGNVELHFGVGAAAKTNTVRFRYRLDGHDRDWIEAGSGRMAAYTGLAPGRYCFEVVACAAGEECGEGAARAQLHLLPHWYQTWWWYLSLAVAAATAFVATLAGLVYWLVRIARRSSRPAAQWTTEDQRHLGILSICHYVVAGFGSLWGCFPLIYVVMGALFLAGWPEAKGDEAPPAILGAFMVGGGLTFTLLAFSLAGCIVAAGRFLAQRRRYVFCFVMAIVQMVLCNPFGTVLGVFTLIVLLRPTVKALFDDGTHAGDPAR